MSGFNLSEWALGHKSFVFFLMALAAFAGLFSYERLGREEDPPFTIKTMVVRTLWPGATAAQTITQVTDRIEKKLEEIPGLDNVKSYTKPGDSVVFVNLKDSVRPDEVADRWYQVRKKIEDIRVNLPSDIRGPYFNDEFGDTYSIVYAFTADGFSFRELRDAVEGVRTELLRVPGVAKVDFIGTQDEKVYLEFSTSQLAALGIDPGQLSEMLQAQNAITPSGTVETGAERVAIRVSGGFRSIDDLKAVTFSISGRSVALSDIATITRSEVDPPQPMFRFNGQPAIGLAVSMTQGGDVLGLGEHMTETMKRVAAELPVGIDVHLAANQPRVVEESVGEFTKSLMEAIAIVLAVSFVALGWRPGIVVAVAIPLVLAITFVAMRQLDISLQRISLGALIIALGLLVDDAMIAVEMMIAKMEEGYSKTAAACFAYTTTAFPMLTGTLVTIAGFLPIGFAQSGAGEYCFTMFAVIGIALIASWIVAVLFTPLTGVFILRDVRAHHNARGRGGPFLAAFFRRLLAASMRRSWITIAVTIALFAAALVGLEHVQQEFFPASDRPELLVSVTLPQNASIGATEAEVERIEKLLAADADIDSWTFYVGQGAVRFYLPLDAQLANDYFAQAVVVTKGYEQRAGVQHRLETAMARDAGDTLVRISPLEQGPPVGWPLKFRISGHSVEETRELAQSFAQVLGSDPAVRNVNMDWNEQSKVVRIDVDQDRARSLGLSSQQISAAINATLSGTTITQLRDATYLIDVVARARDDERADIQAIRNLAVATPGGKRVPISQVARISYAMEPPLVWRRDRMPTVTAQADVAPGVEAATVVKRLEEPIARFRAALPDGATLTIGGTAEDSAKSLASIAAVAPYMLLLITFILMVQLMSLQRLAIVMLTAPLALIGVVSVFLVTGTPMGFVAILGIISLIGMVIRNAVILIVQIEHNIAAGQPAWEAVVDATSHRLRPILLTAAAAILGMIPIAPTVFWGPMAYAVMGGLAVATLLTLIFLPALYVAWFRISPLDAGAAEPIGPTSVIPAPGLAAA